MDKKMKIMIAYDGSSFADHAIDDLRLAGLPVRGDALVVSVAGISKASVAPSCQMGFLGKLSSTAILEETVAMMQRERSRARNKAISRAIRGGKRFYAMFPEWRVRSQIGSGNPAEELLNKAQEFKPDLLVVGSNGRSTIGRFFLGSVSRELAEKADCTVRVGRQTVKGTAEIPNLVIVGASSLLDAEEIIRTIGKRRWKQATDIRLVVADDGISAGRVSAVYPYAKAMFEQSVEELRATGGRISVDIQCGEIAAILLKEAADWKADSIFIVDERANDVNGLSNLTANLMTHAKCTVEIVR